ncbi:MAG TPA: hypothetical protein VIR82_12320 [Bradyrhizobium sp.]
MTKEQQQAKHTQGPWDFQEEYGDTGQRFTAVRDGRYETVCIIDGHENEADARLIAAAPDLLEALKEAESLLEQTLRWRGEGWECSEAELLGGIRAAIAKAEGH